MFWLLAGSLSVALSLLIWAVRRYGQRSVLHEAIFQCFVKHAPESGDANLLNSMAVDADWVALMLCGFSVETRIKKLNLDDEVRVSLVAEDVIKVANKLVERGYLRYYAVSFDNQGKNQKINSHPPSLFLLAPKGRLEVVKRIKKKGIKSCSDRVPSTVQRPS